MFERIVSSSKVIHVMQVKSVLGLTSPAATGPSGEEHWDSVSHEAKQQADAFLKYVQ